ncbi:hypothetical protein ACI3EY_13095 [Ornithinimicrobium sp. LYQ92]|uniref:hypothetical protein n=1 Tax=Serinicoccus sp. LYQ92 TaxID=3378798 RepID=UPI003854B4FA
MSVLGRYWNSRFATWGPRRPQEAGYSVLVPVPGDLPVFLELALAVVATQRAEGRVETLVLPDVLTPEVKRIVERSATSWDGPLTLAPLPYPERVVLPRMRNPSRNHGVQLITGVASARSEFVVLHDADLFLMHPSLLDDRVVMAGREDLDVLGVDPVWDQWFVEQGVALAATWDVIARTDWARSFPPSMHMGHRGELLGQQHTFDTTLHPQAVSDPARRRVLPSDDVVHFNYVISTYRHLQRSGDGFVDDRFRILLIRLFIDLFAREPFTYRVPTLEVLAKGMRGEWSPVRYPPPVAEVCQLYADFRRKVDRILSGPWAPPEATQDLASRLMPFDEYYS